MGIRRSTDCLLTTSTTAWGGRGKGEYTLILWEYFIACMHICYLRFYIVVSIAYPCRQLRRQLVECWLCNINVGGCRIKRHWHIFSECAWCDWGKQQITSVLGSGSVCRDSLRHDAGNLDARKQRCVVIHVSVWKIEENSLFILSAVRFTHSPWDEKRNTKGSIEIWSSYVMTIKINVRTAYISNVLPWRWMQYVPQK
jgi:hypothetical protein